MTTTTNPPPEKQADVLAVDTAEACRLTNLSKTTLWRLEKRNQIKSTMILGCKRWPVKQLTKLIQDGAAKEPKQSN